MSLEDDVYGRTFKAASEQMQMLQQALVQKQGQGFDNLQELIEWAHEHHLDKVLFSNMNHQFMCISHKGEIMLPKVYTRYYGNILFYYQRVDGAITRITWYPEGFEFYDKAYVGAEQSDGVHRPLYYRDYVVPTGYYSEIRDAFNVAKPFPVFAANTGRDTSHIYTYIEHVAGECAWHLLAWLRAKLLYPTVKTQVVPIIVSRAQGSGKTTFAEVICKGLFGKDNVIVSDQYDATARFNADYADALIVCQEEKEETDKRNPAGALKSRATATTVRKEQKGVDPIYQESYTDFVLTTNKDVPIKFDGREDQRRFMVMEADAHFTRKESALADEVFTKLYGYDANFQRKGKPFVEDKELIAQFKHELFTREDIASIELRNFPKTAAYKRCFTLPRTSEATEIESIMRAIAPFIKASLENKSVVLEVGELSLSDVIQHTGALQYMPAYKEHVAYVALCRPLVFYETGTLKPFTHSTVERTIYDCAQWLAEEYNIAIIPDMDPLLGGFTAVAGRYRTAAAAKFCSLNDATLKTEHTDYERVNTQPPLARRLGTRFRVNKDFKHDSNGCFETVNELKPGVRTLKHKTEDVQYMDTFLLESDTPSAIQKSVEQQRASSYDEGEVVQAEDLYKERLELALAESQRLFDDGIVARIVYSGAKSYHLLIRVADSPNTLDEYRWLHAWLCSNVSDKLTFDESTSDPARLTRSPLTLERVTEAYGLTVKGTQKLIAENWKHVYDVNWRPLYNAWLVRPLTNLEKYNGKRAYPTKQEYVDAASDIIEGVFWSDSKYDGDRQRLFFPAYRVLRVLGYSNSDIFDDILPSGLSNYAKQQEIGYWLSRKNSAIITQIDSDIDAYDEQFEEDDE